MTPTCWLDFDGEHFWFDHECRPADNPTLHDWRIESGFSSAHMLPNGPDGWTITQKDPLTVEPSILCGACGVHGFFRNGAWTNA
jgi:hypothetical protein